MARKKASTKKQSAKNSKTVEQDPTEPIRIAASQYPGVDKGTACTQSSFKTGNKAFLFIGEQGGRFKAMFKLEASKNEAAQLAKRNPDNFQVGNTAWVTARFSAEQPLPISLWRKWLDESYQLSASTAPAKKKQVKKKTAKKKPTKKTSPKHAKKKK